MTELDPIIRIRLIAKLDRVEIPPVRERFLRGRNLYLVTLGDDGVSAGTMLGLDLV